MKLTAGEIAKILGVSRQAVNKRAKAEGWKYEEVPNPRGGKPLKKFIVEELPPDVREKLQCNFNATNATNATKSNATCGQIELSAENLKEKIELENKSLPPLLPKLRLPKNSPKSWSFQPKF